MREFAIEFESKCHSQIYPNLGTLTFLFSDILENELKHTTHMKYPIILTSALLSLGAAEAATTFTAAVDTDILNAANWDNGLPGVGNDGFINIDAGYSGLSQTGNITNGGTVTVGNGATLTCNLDLAINSSTAVLVINDATLNATDDIFVQAGTLILNAGSVSSAVDDWQVNAAAGHAIINGGMHTAGDLFGTQSSTGGNLLEIFGGSINAARFDFSLNSTTTIAGNSVLSGGSVIDAAGVINFNNAWSGSWTVTTFTGSDWETLVTNGSNGFQLNGVAVDSTIFANNFSVSGDGTTLTLVPEPSSSALLGIAGLVLITRRRR